MIQELKMANEKEYVTTLNRYGAKLVKFDPTAKSTSGSKNKFTCKIAEKRKKLKTDRAK